jgi:hypothetical protein
VWYFGTVPTLWYFGTVPDSVVFFVFILDLGTVLTVWYFGTVPTLWYFGTVPNSVVFWYCSRQCGILVLFRQCGILVLFRQCGILVLFRQCGILVFNFITLFRTPSKEFEDTKRVIRIYNSIQDRQHNVQIKKDKNYTAN